MLGGRHALMNAYVLAEIIPAWILSSGYVGVSMSTNIRHGVMLGEVDQIIFAWSDTISSSQKKYGALSTYPI